MSSTRTLEAVKYLFRLISYSVTIEEHASNNTMPEHRYNTQLIPTLGFEYYRLPLHDLQRQRQHKICQAFYRQ
jgi:hypothetical protein